MEEEAFLVPMDRVVGGIQIQHDVFERPVLGLEKEIDEEVLSAAV